MKNIKRITMFVFALVLGLGTMLGLSACGKNDNQKINIVCTIFSEYDWASEIIGNEKDSLI